MVAEFSFSSSASVDQELSHHRWLRQDSPTNGASETAIGKETADVRCAKVQSMLFSLLLEGLQEQRYWQSPNMMQAQPAMQGMANSHNDDANGARPCYPGRLVGLDHFFLLW